MKMKRWLSCTLALAMLLGLMGCGGTSDEAPNDGSGSSEDEIVINYPTFQIGTNTAAPVVEELVSRFNEEYAGQYRIEVEEIPGDANYADRIQVQISSGKLPPVVYGGGYSLLDLALEADLVVDLTDVVNEDPEWASMYENDAWQAANCRDGKIYASSNEGQLIGYFYNKELFEKAGISDVPVTVSELKDCVEKLKASGITPFAAGYATEWTIGQFLGYGASSILTPAAVELGDDYKKGNWTFDQPGIDQAFDVLDLVADNTQDRPFDTDVSGQYAAFAKGDAAMMLQGNWSILQIRELNPDIKMGMFPLPISEDKEALLFPKQYGFVINVLAASEEDPAKAEAINQFMEYFLNPENGGGYYYDEIGVPTANAVAEPELDEASEILQTYLQDEKTVFTYYAYEPAGFDAESWKVTVQYLNSGTKDHKKLIEDFDNAFNKYADALE